MGRTSFIGDVRDGHKTVLVNDLHCSCCHLKINSCGTLRETLRKGLCKRCLFVSMTPLYTWLLQLAEPLWLLLMLVVTLVIFVYLDAVRMLRRQAFLAFVYASAGKVRRWLWDSLILRIAYVVLAVGLALLAVLIAAHLHWLEWLVFAGGLISLVVLNRLFSHGLRHETQPEFHAIVVLRVSAWCNLALMVMVLALVQLVWLELPDTRAFALTDYIAHAWQQYDPSEAAVPAFAWLLALSGVLQEIQWYWLQQASTVALPVGLKISAWFAVLVLQATKLGVLQLVVLGGVSILTRHVSTRHVSTRHGSTQHGSTRHDSTQHDSTQHGSVREHSVTAEPVIVTTRHRLFRRSFVLTLLAVLVAYLMLAHGPTLWRHVSSAPTELETTEPSPPSQVASDPCAESNAAGLTRRQVELARFNQSLSVALEAEKTAAQERLYADIEAQVAVAYDYAEAGVDAFLDWNFSIAGQYAQLVYLAGASVSQASFADYLSSKMNEFIREPLTPALLSAQRELNRGMEAEIERAGQVYQGLFAHYAAQTACWQQPQLNFDPTAYVDKSLVGLGAGAALATRLALAAGTRTATRSGVRRAISALFTRGVARAGAVSSGGAGAVCGPWAIVCTPAIIATAWLATDYGLNRADEALNRETMKAEMMAALRAEQVETVAALYGFYANLLAEFYAELDEHQTRQFNILRDGVR